jgi:hypothetical protein
MVLAHTMVAYTPLKETDLSRFGGHSGFGAAIPKAPPADNALTTIIDTASQRDRHERLIHNAEKGFKRQEKTSLTNGLQQSPISSSPKRPFQGVEADFSPFRHNRDNCK